MSSVDKKRQADIPESYFEHSATFSEPIFEAWTSPNRFVAALYASLSKWGIGLDDITWNKDNASARDLEITINVPRVRAAIKVRLEAFTFIALNPDWTEAPQLIELFEAALKSLLEQVGVKISSQQTALAMHVKPYETPYSVLTAKLVNTDILGRASMYGVSAYDGDLSFIIDKSLRYPDSVFIRITRNFGAAVEFKQIATALYEDESRVLGMIGLQELLP